MISLENETVQQIIADIMGDSCEWKPNGAVSEGYRINVGKDIFDISYENFLIDRLRIRMNTIVRLYIKLATIQHKLHSENLDVWALRYWCFKQVNTDFLELRIYDGFLSPYKKLPCVRDVRLFEEMTAKHRDGYMSLAEFMLIRAYLYKRGDGPTGDLLKDFSRDTELQDEYYATSEHLYNHICRSADAGCMEALDGIVADYRKYCQAYHLEYDAFKTFEEDEQGYADE